MDLATILNEAHLDLPTVAHLAGLDLARLQQIFAGTGASVAEIGAIADALAIDERVLLNGVPVGQIPWEQDGVRLRAAPGLQRLNAIDQRQLARLSQLLSETAALQAEIFGSLEQSFRLERQPVALSGSAPHQGYELARDARARLGLGGTSPIQSVAALFRQCGIAVVDLPLSLADVEAISIVDSGKTPCVVINTSHGRTRNPLLRRAILAHELCHQLHDVGTDARLLRATFDGYNDGIEERAQAFGAELLAPNSGVKELGPGLGDVALVERIAREYGVSCESAWWRAKNAGRVPHDVKLQSRILRKLANTSIDGFDEDGPQRQDTMAQSLLLEIIDAAARATLISEGRANELRGWR